MSMVDDRTCMLKVWTVNPEGDTTSWYEIWEAINAIYFKCINFEKRGTLRGLGKSNSNSW